MAFYAKTCSVHTTLWSLVHAAVCTSVQGGSDSWWWWPLGVNAPAPHPHFPCKDQEGNMTSFCFFGRWRCTSCPPRTSSTWPCACSPSPAPPRLDRRHSVGLSWWTLFSSCVETGAFISVSSPPSLTALWIYNRSEYVNNWTTARGWQPSSASELPHLKVRLVFQWGRGRFCRFRMEFSSLAVSFNYFLPSFPATIMLYPHYSTPFSERVGQNDAGGLRFVVLRTLGCTYKHMEACRVVWSDR